MIDSDGVYWTAKSEETLLDPDYRGQRWLGKMYGLLFRYAEEHEFSWVWGFTPAEKALTRVNFTIPGVTQQLFMPFSPRSVEAITGKLSGDRPSDARARIKAAAIRVVSPAAQIVSAAKIALTSRTLPSGLEIRTMNEPDEQAGNCAERFVEQWGGTTIYRDADYMRWRLFENPYVKSIVRAIYDGEKLLGWTAYTLGDDGLGYLVDMFVSCDNSCYQPRSLIRQLLLEAVLGARNMGATGIRGWRVNQHPFDRLVCREARKIGFYHIKRGRAVVLYNLPAGRKRISFDKFDDWYISRIFTEGVLS